MSATDPTGEVTELLQHLIRNACVNDGTPGSGGEARSADLLADHLHGTGLDIERYEPTPGRASVLTRIEGSDPGAPSLLLMGHTDVVPASPERWRRDPFAGDLVDGEVWGRGAVDMLNLTSSMAVAVRRLASDGFRPRGTLGYLAVADEEALGTHGAAWLTEHQADAVRFDHVITEFGGARLPVPSASGPKLPVTVAEKGTYWCTIRVHGTPGHASMPLGADNAVVGAAEVVRRLAGHLPEPAVHDVWRRFVEGLDLDPALAETLLDPAGIRGFLAAAPDAGLARLVHACTHTTVAPTILHGGVKTNVIPDRADLQVDVRTLPGQTGEEIREMLLGVLGDLGDRVEILATSDDAASSSAVDTPLWGSLSRATEALSPGSGLVPFMVPGATDARFFRRLGATAYGFGLYSERVAFSEFVAMFHGDDERVDQESLRLSTELWMAVARDLLG